MTCRRAVMDPNITVSTSKQIVDFFNMSVHNLTNLSEVEQHKISELHEDYKKQELELLHIYKHVAYVVGTLIILTNFSVVISSGLILKKGQQPKSTYLLLGNVSLADSIIGVSMILGFIMDTSSSSNISCVIFIGMLVCPIMVSIFSVGLIAIDRYIYILHGLYYQRWFTTTRVRIAILCIWMIGIVLGFMPITGWTNTEVNFARCSYTALFPNSLTLFNAVLSLFPIALVAVLYSIILVHALKNIKQIKSATKKVKTNKNNDGEPNLRIYRGKSNTQKIKSSLDANVKGINRCASFPCNTANDVKTKDIAIKSKSINDLCRGNEEALKNDFLKSKRETYKTQYESNISIYSITSDSSNSIGDTKEPTEINMNKLKIKLPKKATKANKPNKWRAVTVVMLTSGSIIISWTPYFITIIAYLLCEEKLTNPQCKYYRKLIAGPLLAMAFLNSVLNPLIYAWWHKGFQTSARAYFQKYIGRFICRK